MLIVANVETGEIIEREYTEPELKVLKKDQELIKALAAEEAEKQAAKQALLDKLGLTEDEAKLLLG